MSKIADVEANATSLDGLVNDNALVPTLRNGPKPSYQYLVDGWNAEIAATILELNKSRGFRVVGTFADGFTYELPNDVGIDASGNPWIYNGALPFTVTAGTTPTSPTYTQVIYGAASQVSTNTSDTVQSFIDSFALKVFQSPTDGGLTEIQTRTVNGGEVYEVRKTSDNSLATIYSNAAGTIEIVQNGTDNKSGSDGVVEFYIGNTFEELKVETGSGGAKFKNITFILFSSNVTLSTVAEMKTKYLMPGQTVNTVNNKSSAEGGSWEYVIKTSAQATADGDVFSASSNINILLDNGNVAVGNVDKLVSPRQAGWDETGGLDNYNIMAEYINNGVLNNNYKQLYTINYFAMQWIAGNKFPLAFYGDSTTDGATTTDHVASFVPNRNDFSSPITINNSPNSYPNKLKDWLDVTIPSNNGRIYNAGFDSMSLSNNFGTKCFHRTFFGFGSGLNNVDYSDVKGIALSWGTSDSINLYNIDTILDSYEWKMELLIVECFERGIQPFINDPVLNFQRTGSLVNGRQNDQSISIIESINQRLRVKYNLEQLSLRKPLENYAEYAFEQDGDLGEVLSPDGVHPNDKGHTTIASWMAAALNPLIKRFAKDDTYRFTAGNPYPVTTPQTAGTDIWRVTDTNSLNSRTSFYYRFDPVSSNQFMYRIFVFCEHPMDLTYDCYSVGNDQKVDDRIAKVEVTNFSDVSSRKGRLFADNQGTGSPWFAGSHQLVARLKVGLNQINVIAPEAAVYTRQNLGYLRVEPRDQSSFVAEKVSAGFATFELKTEHAGISIISSKPANSIIWGSREFKRSEYHYTKNGRSSLLKFTINTLHNREIAWNGNRTFRDYDCYNLLKFSGTSIELYKVKPTSNVDYTPLETLIGSTTANVDLSTITEFESYYITINHDIANTTVIIQRLRNSTGATSTLGTITLSTQGTQPFAGGYGVGANKSGVDGIPMLIKDISFDFVS